MAVLGSAGKGFSGAVTSLAVLILSAASSLQSVHAEDNAPRFLDPGARSTTAELSSLPRLRFLSTLDFAPFSALDAKGVLSGFNIDLAREICRTLGVAAKCDVQALPWGELAPALARGQGEAILAGIAISPQSRQIYAFSQPYLRFPGRFIVRKPDIAQEPMEDALAGSTVGVVTGSAHETFLRQRFDGLTLKTYADANAMLQALSEGSIRAAFGDGMRLSFWLDGEAGASCRFAGGAYWAPTYFGSGLAVATRPGDRELSFAIDFALRELSANGRFRELYLRWFPVGFY